MTLQSLSPAGCRSDAASGPAARTFVVECEHLLAACDRQPTRVPALQTLSLHVQIGVWRSEQTAALRFEQAVNARCRLCTCADRDLAAGVASAGCGVIADSFSLPARWRHTQFFTAVLSHTGTAFVCNNRNVCGAFFLVCVDSFQISCHKCFGSQFSSSC